MKISRNIETIIISKCNVSHFEIHIGDIKKLIYKCFRINISFHYYQVIQLFRIFISNINVKLQISTLIHISMN